MTPDGCSASQFSSTATIKSRREFGPGGLSLYPRKQARGGSEDDGQSLGGGLTTPDVQRYEGTPFWTARMPFQNGSLIARLYDGSKKYLSMHPQQDGLRNIRNEHHKAQPGYECERQQGDAAGESKDVVQHYVPAPGMKQRISILPAEF